MAGADARPSSIPKSPGVKSSRGFVSGEYKNISFIHEIADCSVEDITADILSEAALPDVGTASADLQASHFDHLRDLRKHETV